MLNGSEDVVHTQPACWYSSLNMIYPVCGTITYLLYLELEIFCFEASEFAREVIFLAAFHKSECLVIS